MTFDSLSQTRSEADAQALLDAVAAQLRAKGERMSAPRRAVLTALATTEGHLSTEEIAAAVAEIAPKVHRTSVYRALAALSELGVVQHVHLGHGATAYHLTDDHGPHLHAQCRQCGQIIDLPADLLVGVADRMGALHGFELDATHVALSGLCSACAELGGPTTHRHGGSPIATKLH